MNKIWNWCNGLAETDFFNLIKLYIKIRNTAPENVFKS